MAIFSLYTRDVVRVSGEGAHKLLNDTLTCRFDDTLSGTGRWFALLSPQGKVQIEGLVTYASDAWWFDLEAGLVADFVKRMKLYRLRAKAEIEHLATHAVLWSPDGEKPTSAEAIAYADERGGGLGTRFILDWAGARPTPLPELDPTEIYTAARIAAGVPEFPDFGANEVFAHDIGLDLLNGIDFVKGCYIGQEVVSRMKHRGTARRRPVMVSGIDAAVETGSLIASVREAGTLGAVVDGKAVAILRLDRITDLAAVTVDGKPVTLTLPGWATYQFGEAAED